MRLTVLVVVVAPSTAHVRYNVAVLDVLVGNHSLGLPSFVYAYDNDAIG